MSSEKIQRPLSPHLQIYKPQITSVLSILHRMTGAALAIGTILVVAVLVAAATSEGAYDQVMSWIAHPLGQFAMAGWSFALIYHTCNGIRHLIWDTGQMMTISSATKAGHLVFWGAVVITASLWAYVKSDGIPIDASSVVEQLEETTETTEEGAQ